MSGILVPYCVKTGDILPYHDNVYVRVCMYLRSISFESGIPTCHEVCAELAKRIPELVHYKGYFAEVNDHSWLVFKDDENTLIDAYPIAVASGPILLTLEGTIANPWYRLYKGASVNAL